MNQNNIKMFTLMVLTLTFATHTSKDTSSPYPNSQNRIAVTKAILSQK